MNQHEFQELSERYLRGDCTPEEERQMQVWTQQTLAEAPNPLSDAEQAIVGKRLRDQITRRTTRPLWRVSRLGWAWAGVAASVALCILVGSWFWVLNKERSRYGLSWQTPALRGVIDVKNTSTKPQSITLGDGSQVVLKPNSSVSYPEHFGSKTRSVLLRGEAFFNVRRNPAKPFVVHTGALATEVLGTSFTIRSYDDAPQIEVLVKTGRVSVYETGTTARRARNGLILTPNQKATFDKRSKTLLPGLTETPTPVAPPAHRESMVFDDAPLGDVLTTLQTAYGIELVLENQQLAQCRFTADLNDLPLYTQLDLLCRSVGATYEQRGTGIFINGDGCR